MDNKIIEKQVVKYLLLVAALVLTVLNFSKIMQALKVLWTILLPLVVGFTIAYVVNIIEVKLEKHYFPASKSSGVNKSRKPVCLLLSYILIILALLLIIDIVLPQVMNAVDQTVAVFPLYLERINDWISENKEQFPIISDRIAELNWDTIANRVITYMTQGISDIISSSVNVISILLSTVFNLFVSIAFSVYLLVGKEKLLLQCKQLQKVFMGERSAQRMDTVLAVAHKSFQSFIVGQCTEAIILGALCTLGMWIFRFPYATAIGVFVGTTALIPIFGAWMGAIVGVLLILTIDPVKAILFVLFILALQQLESNLIYPRVVGTSIGLPGIWVFAAVIVGSGLGGVMGMLLGVPLMSIAYKLLRMTVAKKQT